MATKKERPRGVTIFGILLIATSLMQITEWLMPRYFNYYKEIFQPLPEHMIRLRYFISAIRRLSGSVVGIGILCRKDIFRKILLLIAAFTIFTLYWKHPFFAVQNHARNVTSHLSKMMGDCEYITPSTVRLVAIVSLVGLYAMDMAFSVALIYYFTRPRVREWFKD